MPLMCLHKCCFPQASVFTLLGGSRQLCGEERPPGHRCRLAVCPTSHSPSSHFLFAAPSPTIWLVRQGRSRQQRRGRGRPQNPANSSGFCVLSPPRPQGHWALRGSDSCCVSPPQDPLLSSLSWVNR